MGLTGVCIPLFAEFFLRFFFFTLGKSCIHPDQYGKHDEGEKRRPLEEETEHDEDKRNILRLADAGVRTGHRKPVGPLRRIEHLPGTGEKRETVNNQNVAYKVKRAEMRVPAPAKEILKKVPRIMREWIKSGYPFRKPAGKQVNGEWESVHLREQSDDERGESAVLMFVLLCRNLFGGVDRIGIFISVLIGMPSVSLEHHPNVRDYKDTDKNWPKVSA